MTERKYIVGQSYIDKSTKKNEADQLKAGHHGVPLSVFKEKFFFGQDKFNDLLKELRKHGLK